MKSKTVNSIFLSSVINGKDFVEVLVQGEGLCTKADMLVREWGKLAGIKDTEGKGYRGAELKGLKIALEEGSTGTEFIYKDLDRIVD